MKKQSWIENTIKLIEYHNNKKENIRIKLEKSGINNHFLEPESISIKTKNFCKSILGSFTNYIPIYSKKWFKHNADKLWETRELLENEKSKSFYDSSLILKTANHQKFLFNETYNNNFLEILSEKPFNHKTLPNIYNKKMLAIFNIKINDQQATNKNINIISTLFYLQSINKFQQYLINQDNVNFIPKNDDVIIDCGACIGDTALLFASLINQNGSVHVFDPIDLHIKLCELQIELNPWAKEKILLNNVGVSNKKNISIEPQHIKNISPAQQINSTFSTLTLDEYTKNLKKVDYIKMDIEGSELKALTGAQETIKKFKPKLAICGYHKPNDYWTIPQKIKHINPDYKLYFEHHSLKIGESVFYAL